MAIGKKQDIGDIIRDAISAVGKPKRRIMGKTGRKGPPKDEPKDVPSRRGKRIGPQRGPRKYREMPKRTPRPTRNY